MIQSSTLLTIQKFIALLNDFHYKEFTGHLSSINASLPLKLSEAIRKKLPEFDSHEDLCGKIYGGFNKNQRQAFNQLSSHTFRLSHYLVQNYPGYLVHNVQELQRLVNEGRVNEADFLADCLLEISERIEDFQTQIFVLQFLIQQAYLTKEPSTAGKLNKKLEEAFANAQKFHQIILRLRNSLNISTSGTMEPKALESHKDYFKSFHNDPAISVQILSKYSLLYTMYYFEPEAFAESSTLDLIRRLEKKLDLYNYIVFPFMFDINSTFSFLKLNSALIDLDNTEGKKDFDKLTEHYGLVKFWKNYLNIPQLLSIAVQATHYLSSYHYLVHRSDYKKLIPENDLKQIQGLIVKCQELLNLKIWDTKYKNDLISLRMLYGGLLILSGGENVTKGVQELESLLITYQQVNLAGSTDTIFLCMMIGYFAIKKYDECNDTYKRYMKITTDKPVYDDNDISIHTYYYLSRWLTTERDQYIIKLKSNFDRAKVPSGPQKAMEELIQFFEIPVQLQEA